VVTLKRASSTTNTTWDQKMQAMERANESSWGRRIDLVVQSLQRQLGTTVEAGAIRAEVEAAFAAYSEARIREFVPVLVETRVRSHLVRQPRG
jgi:hypothetical protein